MLGIKIPFKQQQFEAREEAILDAVNRLLSEKGFDLMTMDDVADAVGVAKGSLYKHFSSKEKLAAAVMIRLLSQTLETLQQMPADWPAVRQLEEILRWSLHQRMRGGVPLLPSTRGALQRALMMNLEYLALAFKVNTKFHALVERAKSDGDVARDVPDEVVVYTLYARSCDPTVDYLRRDGKLSDDQIVEAMVAATFHGLAGLKK
ncbi:MAG: TetR/AcrR family transcriptional regulator [Betaproteobacteria bacterium]|nr:TetR/AcrR family transcriptional regulator [Betaproteobacteria bacterium]